MNQNFILSLLPITFFLALNNLWRIPELKTINQGWRLVIHRVGSIGSRRKTINEFLSLIRRKVKTLRNIERFLLKLITLHKWRVTGLQITMPTQLGMRLNHRASINHQQRQTAGRPMVADRMSPT